MPSFENDENLPFNAAYMNDVESLRLAFESGLNLNQPHPRSGHTPLQAACETDAIDAINYLLKVCNVDPNFRFTKVSRVDGHTICNKCTALMQVRSLEAAELLLLSGADASLLDGDGLSAIDWAKERELEDVVEILSSLP